MALRVQPQVEPLVGGEPTESFVEIPSAGKPTSAIAEVGLDVDLLDPIQRPLEGSIPYREAFQLAERGNGREFPAGFRQWDLHDPDGVLCLAHLAARNGRLPEDFDQWDIRDRYGRTVAHEAALAGTLPAFFDQWEMVGPTPVYGWCSVAHAAAWSGHLPEKFDRWELATEDGWTVAHVVAVKGG